METRACIGPLHDGAAIDVTLFGKGQKACRECKAEYNRRAYIDPEKKAQKLALNREYKKANREAMRDYNRKWQQDNPDKVEVIRARYEKHLPVRLGKNLIRRIDGAFGLKITRDQLPYYLGCTIDEWISHLEKRFTVAMGWMNYGASDRRSWEVDHIMPLSSFGTDIEDILRALHFTNTRPLWSSENRSKGAKMPSALEAGYQTAA